LRHRFLEKAAKAVDKEDVLSPSRSDHLVSIAELQAIVHAVLAHTRLLVATKKHLLQGQGRSPHNNNASEAHPTRQPPGSHHPHHSSSNGKHRLHHPPGKEPKDDPFTPPLFTSLDLDSLDMLFGESILATPPLILLQKVLFGAISVASPSQTFKLAAASLPLARSRLTTLAHQLYMPLDMLLDEAESFYGGLLRDEYFASMSSSMCTYQDMELDDAA